MGAGHLLSKQCVSHVVMHALNTFSGLSFQLCVQINMNERESNYNTMRRMIHGKP